MTCQMIYTTTGFPTAQRAGGSGYVYDTESGSAVDGPGIRYVVFLSGCPLNCQYCHNPDSQRMKKGTQQSLEQVMAQIKESAPMLKRMRGGVTVSGGEPLVQAVFTQRILEECKALGLHTALDTSGYLGKRASAEMLAATDMVLLDIKSMIPETYKKVTGVDLAPTIEFAEHLADIGKPVWIRFVLVPDLTDAPENIEALGKFVALLPNVQRLEVLPFHKLGEHKWELTTVDYQLDDTPAPQPEQVTYARQILRDCGVQVVV